MSLSGQVSGTETATLGGALIPKVAHAHPGFGHAPILIKVCFLGGPAGAAATPEDDFNEDDVDDEDEYEEEEEVEELPGPSYPEPPERE